MARLTRWLSTNTLEDRQAYVEINRKARTTISRAKNEAWRRKCASVNSYLGGTRSREAWKTIQEAKSNKKDSAITHNIDLTTWETYFSQLLMENRVEFQDPYNIGGPINNVHIPLITVKELKYTLKTMKNGKSPGPGGIPMELIKEAPDNILEYLIGIFNKCLIYDEDIPIEMIAAYVHPIFKKGKKTDCNNYRAISVISSCGRLYGKIIKNRIQEQVTDIEEQSGFRAGRSCIDNLFVLQQLLEKRMARGRESHLIFIDLQKAYDSVPQSKLFEVLKDSPIGECYVRSIYKLYERNTNKAKQGSALSNCFQITKGLRQGCSLSPLLFKIYLSRVLEQWMRKCGQMGVEIGEDILFTLLFADDQVLIASDEEDVNYMFRKLQETYQQWGLTINTEKTKYLVVGGEGRDLVIDQFTHIKNVQEYIYLGSTIDKTGSCQKDMQNKINKGKRIIQALNPFLWQDELTQNTKTKMYKTIVESVATYGSEVWGMTKKNKSKFETLQMNYLRRCCRVTLLDHIPNEEIKRRTNVDRSTVDTIENKQLIWYGHVRRMREERWPKKIWEWTPPEHRKRGRPRRTWSEGIRSAIDRRHMDDEDWRDRSRWRSMLFAS